MVEERLLPRVTKDLPSEEFADRITRQDQTFAEVFGGLWPTERVLASRPVLPPVLRGFGDLKALVMEGYWCGQPLLSQTRDELDAIDEVRIGYGYVDPPGRVFRNRLAVVAERLTKAGYVVGSVLVYALKSAQER